MTRSSLQVTADDQLFLRSDLRVHAVDYRRQTQHKQGFWSLGGARGYTVPLALFGAFVQGGSNAAMLTKGKTKRRNFIKHWKIGLECESTLSRSCYVQFVFETFNILLAKLSLCTFCVVHTLVFVQAAPQIQDPRHSRHPQHTQSSPLRPQLGQHPLPSRLESADQSEAFVCLCTSLFCALFAQNPSGNSQLGNLDTSDKVPAICSWCPASGAQVAAIGDRIPPAPTRPEATRIEAGIAGFSNEGVSPRVSPSAREHFVGL
eukprot:5766812-Amphidinium_carterae.1